MSSSKLLTPQTSGANVGHGRILTATDYQLVSLYTDLKRSDIENLQSIAGIYDVAQMRGLLKCRLDQMEKRRRYLTHERNADFDAYRVYLDRNYSDRRTHLMPVIRSQQQQRQHKPPIPRITNYPVIRGQRLIGSKKDRVHFASDRTKTVDRQPNRSSTTSTRDEPAVLERTEAAARKRSDAQGCAGKSTKTVRTEKSASRNLLESSKPAPCRSGVRGSAILKGTANRQAKDPASVKINAEVRKIVKLTVCRKKEIEAAKKRCADKGGGKKATEIKDSAGSFGGYENEVSLPSVNEDLPDSYSMRELVVPEEDDRDEESKICPDRVVGTYAEDKEYSPDIARSESLGDELHAVFSRETNPDYLTPFESPDDSEVDDNDDDNDDSDLVAEYATRDDPLKLNVDDSDTWLVLSSNCKGMATSERESRRDQLDADAAADYADGSVPLHNELPMSSVSNPRDNHDDTGYYVVDADKMDAFFDAYDSRGRPIKSKERLFFTA